MPKTRRKNLLRFLPSRRILLVGLVLLVATGVVLAWTRRDDNNPSNTDTTVNPPAESYINYGPATEQEKQETENHKKELANQQNTPQPPSNANGKIAVTPVITGGDSSNIRAYVAGVVEDGGTCTATFTKGTEVIKRTSEGIADATTTICAPPTNLSSGTWSTVVSYSSTNAEGNSQPYELKIQ